jgi:transcriptional regulator with XRE-family HTH domain
MGLLCYLVYFKISLLGYFVNYNIEITIMSQFQNRLRQAMMKKGLTQVELANLAKVSQNSISKWLNGESIPSIDKAMSLARALELSIGELVGDFENNQELTEEDKRFISLTPQQKTLLLKYLDFLENEKIIELMLKYKLE